MGPIGPLELVIVLIILLVIFGPKRLPGLGKSLGSGMREFKDSISGNSKDDEHDDRPALASGPAPASVRMDAAEERRPEETAPVSEPRT